MPPSPTSSDASASSFPDSDENNLETFFILHKATSTKPAGNTNRSGKAWKKIDSSSKSRKVAVKLELERSDDSAEPGYPKSRDEAFNIVWSKIESTIKDVLRDMNVHVFKEIHHWVRESFSLSKSCGTPGFPEATRSYPIITDASSRQLFTGLILTRNMEFVDDLLTFEELGLYLKSQGCHVASLSSLNFLGKNGVGGCLKSLLRQLLMVALDVADMSALASWYQENGNCDNPVVVIINDIERCCGSVFSDVILMLSEWTVKIPVILIMGVATTLDAPRNILSTNALQHLRPSKFTLGTPVEKMDAVVEAVLVKQCSGFVISHDVALFLRNYFLHQDGTLTSFIRALKIACSQHFSMEPLSFMLGQGVQEDSKQVLLDESHGLSSEAILEHAFEFPSCKRNDIAEKTSESLALGLSELKRLQKHWSTAVLCLFEVGKFEKLSLLDLYCEALDPEAYYSRSSGCHLEKASTSTPSSGRSKLGFVIGGFISQSLRKVRDLSTVQLSKLLSRLEYLTGDLTEIHITVKELMSLLKSEGGTCPKQELANTPKKYASRSKLNVQTNVKPLNAKVGALLECIIRDYIQPIECLPFHEIVCFKTVDKLQYAIIGDPRSRIQVDLLEFHKILHCTCCSSRGNSLLPSMHDTSILYTLAQEHSDLINLHDWYQSFKSIAQCKTSKGKSNIKQTPNSKKRKEISEPETITSASIQARFCRAVTELQIAGLIRMPSKRRPDFAQRVAFGL